MWFIFAISNAVLWSIVITFDIYCVKSTFKTPIQGLFITILSASVVLLIAMPIYGWPNLSTAMFGLLAGGLMQIGQLYYFFAMDNAEEAGTLSAVESIYPIFVAIGVILLGNILNVTQWTGIVIIALSIIALTIDRKVKLSGRFIKFISLDIAALSAHALIVDYALKNTSLFSFIVPYYLAILLLGIALLFGNLNERNKFLSNWIPIKKIIPYLFIIEIVNVIAVISGINAINLGNPALATGVMSTTPAFVYIFSNILSNTTLLKGDYIYSRIPRLKYKICIALCLAFGLGLLVI